MGAKADEWVQKRMIFNPNGFNFNDRQNLCLSIIDTYFVGW